MHIEKYASQLKELERHIDVSCVISAYFDIVVEMRILSKIIHFFLSQLAWHEVDIQIFHSHISFN